MSSKNACVMEPTDVATIPNIVADLRKGFETHVTQNVQWRLEQLQNLHTLLSTPSDRELLCRGMYLDLGRSRFEGLMYEIDIALTEVGHFIHELTTNPNFDIEMVGTNLLNAPASSYIRSDPYGVVLVASPWNYPVLLCLQPLAGALAAGNTVLLRPGTYSQHTSAALYTLIKKYFDPAFVNIVIGDRAITTSTLEQKFDFICFTGGYSLGQIYHKAANKHLTPTLLELGGSNPVIVWEDADPVVTARRLVSTAFMNTGQTCIRPQNMFVHSNIVDKFVDEMKDCISSFYTIGNDINEYRTKDSYDKYIASNPTKVLSIGDWCKEQDKLAQENYKKNRSLSITDSKYVSNFEFMKNSPWLGRIINRDAFKRLTNLIEQDRQFVVFGGEYTKINDDTPNNDLYISPTIMVFRDIRDFNNAKSVLNGEIFGPIIPILAIGASSNSPNTTTAATTTTLTTIINWINQHDKPLSLYCYTFDKNVKDEVLRTTSSGSLAFNDSVLQISNSNLPFGGVGPSGMLGYHGKHSLKVFSHQKAVMEKNKFNVKYCDVSLRYPPYTTTNQTLMSSLANLERVQVNNWAVTVPLFAVAAYGAYAALPLLLPYLQSGLDILKDFYTSGATGQ